MSKSLLKSSGANRKGVAIVTAPLPTSKRRRRPNVQADTIANALSLDVGDWWAPEADNFCRMFPRPRSSRPSRQRSARAPPRTCRR